MIGHVQPFFLASYNLFPRKCFLGRFLGELTAPVETVPIGARREGTGGRTEGNGVGIFARLPMQRDRV